MPIIVPKDAFISADNDTKLLLIYGILENQHELLENHVKTQELSCEKRGDKCDKRFLKIELRKKLDTGIAATTGIIGGFIAVIIKSAIFRN